MVLRSLFAAAILAFGLTSASADDLNIQALYEACKSQDLNSSRYGLCLGYVAGIGDLMHAFGAYSQKSQDENFIAFSICGKPSYGAIVQAFVNWAEANPQRWSDDRLFGVAEALRATWPCQ
jgi:hypothetical protein